MDGAQSRLLLRGFSHAELKAHRALLVGADAAPLTAGRMPHHPHPEDARYQLTDFGLRAALFSTRSYARLIRPGFALVIPDTVPGDAVLRRSFQQLERAMDTWCAAAKLAA